jgi:pimeloyl-ACP methyl ester carboxylesterase
MQQVTNKIPGLVLTDHTFAVPLDHADPVGDKIQVFGRLIQSQGDAEAGTDRPLLVFLQGGPGFCAPRPGGDSGWLGLALKTHRVLMLDERGTGRSTPVTVRTLARVGSAAAQASYLMHFRADSIVQDCEHVRRELLGEEGRWSLLGQSYGGFCAVHYLSEAPSHLDKVFLTGGIPPMGNTAQEVYHATFASCVRRNNEYYARYPSDVERMLQIARRLARGDVRLPCGDLLSVRRFQTLGILLGASDGFEELHYLVDHAFAEGEHGMGPAASPYKQELSYVFLRGFENALNYDTNPIYSLLHEACYTQGVASLWAAEKERSNWSQFQWSGPDDERPLGLTGEMIFPWFFDEIGALGSLQETAELLADQAAWPRLYDQGNLAQNSVPVAAAVYTGDMYVDFELSKVAASQIAGIKLWCTGDFEHNGLRADGEKVLGKLIKLLE